MHLDVPYIPDSSYVNLLSRHEQRIHSLHFALPGAPTYDARTFSTGATDTYDFIEGLKSFDGNLLSLLDATGWMADHFNISNARFPQIFLQTLTGCSKICSTCDYCHNLFSRISRPTLGKLGQLG